MSIEGSCLKYACPHCGAALASRGPGDADWSSTSESCECGYSYIDGRTTCPCRSCPEWPRFDEYELVMHFDGKYNEWSCWAKPTTARARFLSIPSAPGSTEDEAKE